MIRRAAGSWPETDDQELGCYFGEPDPPADAGPSRWSEWREAMDLYAARQRSSPAAVAIDLSGQPPRIVPGVFFRAMEVPFTASAAGVQSWWRQESRCGRLEVRAGRLRGTPSFDAETGQVRVVAALARSLPHTWVRMDLELLPWLGSYGTKVCLRPRRPVHPTRHYFLAGHAFLDAFVAGVSRHAAEGAR